MSAFGMFTREAQFEAKLGEIKRNLNVPFDWYPYDSLGNVRNCKALLGSSRTIEDLARGGQVLDIGCADGAIAFFLESRGCHVEAVDLPATNYNQMRGIHRLKEALQSRISIREMDLDRQFTLDRTYSLALFLGILYHLKNPFYALETLARHARFCLLSTRIAEVTPSGRRIKEEPVAYLLDSDEANCDSTNFWIFSEAGLRRLAFRAGWNVVRFESRGCAAESNPRDGDRDERAFCLLESRLVPPLVPVRLLSGWHERENSWRWTELRFSALVAAPVSVCEDTLEFRFHHIHDFPVTLSAMVEGHPLRPATFGGKGEHLYRAMVPQRALGRPELRVDFHLDRAYTATVGDLREMGVIVNFHRPGYPDGDRNLPLTFA